jgi:hypothetical protein
MSDTQNNSNESHSNMINAISSVPFRRSIQSQDTLVAFASDIHSPWLQTVFTRDALQIAKGVSNVGVAIKSEKTGTVVRFVLDYEETGVFDGSEIVAWHFDVIDADRSNGIKHVTIFND